MRRLRSFLFIVLLSGAAGCGAQEQVIRVKDLQGRDRVMGRLGKPLGTVVEIVGTVIDGQSLRDKVHQSSFLLRVEEVAGRRLLLSQLMDFRSSGRVLPRDDLELYEQKHGQRANSLSQQDLEPLKRDYVGQRVRVLGYETGEFSGIPWNWPKDLPSFQATGFGFGGYLVLLKKLSPP